MIGTVSETCADYRIADGGGDYAIGAGGIRTVTIRFAPLSGGEKSCTIPTGSELCPDVVCTGMAIGAECAVSPPSLDFGSVLLGESAVETFTITNTGGGTLNGTISIDCPDFSIQSGGGSYQLGPDQSREATVRFQPLALGRKECVIETGDGRCADLFCIGEAIGPICEVFPESIDFGGVDAGASVDTTFTIRNVGAGVLNGNVSETCAQYQILFGGGIYSLAADESREVTVRFAPPVGGEFPCTIENGDGALQRRHLHRRGDPADLRGRPGIDRLRIDPRRRTRRHDLHDRQPRQRYPRRYRFGDSAASTKSSQAGATSPWGRMKRSW